MLIQSKICVMLPKYVAGQYWLQLLLCFFQSEEESKPKKKTKKKMRPTDGGVFVKRTVTKSASSKNMDLF